MIGINKRQKEVIQHQLESEKAVLEQLEKQYRKALNDINTKIRILESDELTQSRIYRLEYQKALKKQVSAVLEKLHSDEYTTIQEFLSESYTDGFIGTMYDLHGQGVPMILPVDPEEAVKAVMMESKISEGLYESLSVDTKKLTKSISSEISRGIAGGLSINEIARNIGMTTKAPLSRAKTIVRTESHRIEQAAALNAQKKAKSRGADVVKQWDSTLDGGTRPTHRHLDGQIREVDEPFKLGGKSAMYPGDFGDPAEDCNCRCWISQRAKWNLGEDELQTMKDRAEYFGIDKSKDFEDFKEKYLEASKMAATTANDNDWTKAMPRNVSKDERRRIIEYANSKDINAVDLKNFDGDPEVLTASIDAIDKARNTYGMKSKITVGVSQSLPDNEFASTIGSHITFNAKALRNRTITEENIARGNVFASTTVEDMCFHEFGHAFLSEKGNKGLEIAQKAYYNVFGKESDIDGILEYLHGNVSQYSIAFDPDQGKSQMFHQKRYKEVIPEVMAKHNSNPDGFTEEFVDLLKGL